MGREVQMLELRLGLVGEGVRKILVELEILGLVLGGRGRFFWLQVAEIPLRPNRRCAGRIQALSLYLGRIKMQWSPMASNVLRALPMCFFYFYFFYTSMSFSPTADWGGNSGAKDSPAHVTRMDWSCFLRSRTRDCVRAHHRAGQQWPWDRAIVFYRHGHWVSNWVHSAHS